MYLNFEGWTRQCKVNPKVFLNQSAKWNELEWYSPYACNLKTEFQPGCISNRHLWNAKASYENAASVPTEQADFLERIISIRGIMHRFSRMHMGFAWLDRLLIWLIHGHMYEQLNSVNGLIQNCGFICTHPFVWGVPDLITSCNNLDISLIITQCIMT